MSESHNQRSTVGEEIAPGFVTAQEAARRLGINTRTIWRWIQAGKIRQDRITVTVLAVSLDEVARLQGVKHRTGPPATPEPHPTEDYAAWLRWQRKHKEL